MDENEDIHVSDVAHIFAQDIAEKKRIGRGDFHKVRRGGKYLRFMSDNLKGRAKREYTKAGEVRTYSMSEIVTYNEIIKMPEEQASRLVHELVNKYSNKELQHKLGASYYKIYMLQKKYGAYRVDEEARRNIGRGARSREPIKVQPKEPTGAEPVRQTLSLSEALKLHVTGSGLGRDIKTKVPALGGMLEDDKEYTLEIVLTEVRK